MSCGGPSSTYTHKTSTASLGLNAFIFLENHILKEHKMDCGKVKLGGRSECVLDVMFSRRLFFVNSSHERSARNNAADTFCLIFNLLRNFADVKIFLVFLFRNKKK